MKRNMFLVSLLVTGFMIGGINAQAQHKGHKKDFHKQEIHRQVGPPSWAPAHGHRAKTRFVYFRDYDVFYDRTRRVYISLRRGRWVVSARIPVNMRRVNMRRVVRIEVDHFEPHRFRQGIGFSYGYSYNYGYKYGYKKGGDFDDRYEDRFEDRHEDRDGHRSFYSRRD